MPKKKQWWKDKKLLAVRARVLAVVAVLVSVWKKLRKKGKSWLGLLWRGVSVGNVFRLLLWGGFIGIMAVVLFVFYCFLGLPDTSDLWKTQRTPSIQILDAEGKIIAKRGRIQGYALPYSAIPPAMVDAVIAIEDRRFYKHKGLDPKGFTRAMLVNLQARRFVQGGSTITQQLAKNVFLQPRRTIKRKVQELLLAFWLETSLSKEEIVTLYLNRVYFGAGAYGIDAASRRYFDKSARELSIHEAAMLAGLLKAPSRYAPTRNYPAAEKRAKLVLNAMVQIASLTEKEAGEIAAEPVIIREHADGAGANYAIDWILEHLSRYVGRPRSDLLVYTTINANMQTNAELAIQYALKKEGEKFGARQAALIALTPEGEIRAMVGGRSYAKSQFNRAVNGYRQPGSAFKPFVYIAALEAGLKPQDLFIDEPVTVEEWSPSNFTDGYGGEMTMQEAMARSVNTVAVKVAEQIGRGKTIEVAKRMGITSYLHPHPSLTLGTPEVSLLEMVNAYAPMANGGRGTLPFVIKNINTNAGSTLYETPPARIGKVLSRKTIEDINAMMVYSVEKGTGKRARIKGRKIAGKTGTSQSFRDAWFIGYMGSLIVGVWVGNDGGEPMNKATGGTLPAAIWHDFVSRSLGDIEVKPIPGIDDGRFGGRGLFDWFFGE